MIKFNDKAIEKVYLLIVFFLLLWTGCAVLWDHKISHEFPYSYLASDAFQDLDIAQHIKDSGNYRYYSISAGAGYKDVVGQYVPILFTLPAILSYLSGLEVYDTIYLMIFIFSCLSVIMSYILIKQFNRNVAILSLPLSLFLFYGPFYVGFTWGQWGALFGSYFLIATAWSITKLNLDKSFFLFAVLLSGTFYAHPSEATFIFGFSVLYLVYNLVLRKKLDKTELKKYSIGLLLFLIISFNYIIIFMGTFFKGSTTGKQIIDLSNPYTYQFRPLYLTSFDLFLIAIAVGLLISIFYLKKDKVLSILLGWFMLFIGLTNYLGGTAGSRAFQTRFFWPIYLSVFFGLSFYLVFKIFVKRWKLIYSIILSFILLLTIFNVYPEKFTTPGIMNKYNWESLNWIRDKTPADSNILFLYSDVYTHKSPTRRTNKTNYLMNVNDFVESFKNGIIKRSYSVEADCECSNELPYRKSFFEMEHRSSKTGIWDICKFDYFVFDILPEASRQPQLIQLNNIFRAYLLNSRAGEETFNNGLVSVVKNNNVDADCIPAEGVSLVG